MNLVYRNYHLWRNKLASQNGYIWWKTRSIASSESTCKLQYEHGFEISSLACASGEIKIRHQLFSFPFSPKIFAVLFFFKINSKNRVKLLLENCHEVHCVSFAQKQPWNGNLTIFYQGIIFPCISKVVNLSILAVAMFHFRNLTENTLCGLQFQTFIQWTILRYIFANWFFFLNNFRVCFNFSCWLRTDG